MRHRLSTTPVAATMLLALACVGDRTPLATEPPSLSTSPASCDATRIKQLIKALFPPGPSRDGALAKFSGIQTKLSLGKTADARTKMFDLLRMTLAHLAAGKLLRTTGTLGLTTQQAVSELVRRLYACVGLPDPGDLTAAVSAGGAAAVIGPSDPATEVVTGDGHAGAEIPTGALGTQTVLVTLTLAADETDPLPTTLRQYGPAYDLNTFPTVATFNHTLTVGICVTVPEAVAKRVRLAHPNPASPATAIELLPLEPEGFHLACDPLPLASVRPGFLGRLLASARAMVRPARLDAAATLAQGDVTGALTGGLDNAGNPIATVTVAFASVSAGSFSPDSNYSCVVTTDGAAYCWGFNQFGQLGNGMNGAEPWPTAPVPVSAGFTFGAVSAGGLHTCGVATGDAASCWGANFIGQLGIGPTPTDTTMPASVSGALTFGAVSAGGLHTCGVTTGDAVYCWGANFIGQLGIGPTPTGTTTPTAVSGGLTFALVSAGESHTCGVTTDGAGYCWGNNGVGQLGTGSATGPELCEFFWPCSTAPVAVTGGLTFALVSAGAEHTCGVTTDGAAHCWGAAGQLGNGSTTGPESCWPPGPVACSTTPVAVAGGLSFAALSAGGDHTCGVTLGGAAYCWGANYAGQLGNGSTTDATTPALVAGGLTLAVVIAGRGHTCGVTTDGAAYCWGSNTEGQLGDGTTSNRSTPTAVMIP